MADAPWTAEKMPRLDGKIIVVTGANSGIGYEAVRALARVGAHVILACRDRIKTEEAMGRIRAEQAASSLSFMTLDSSSLASVRDFVRTFAEAHSRLDVLINNAGVMALPYRLTTDGFEMQFGTNHLGHFALTAELFDRVAAAPSSRIVNVSSSAHRMGKIRFDDLQWKAGYAKWGAYGQSKLANLLFTYEMNRRIAARGLDVRAVACHPGYAATNLQMVAPRMNHSSFGEKVSGWANSVFAQSAEMGALPTIYAAAATEVQGGDYIGPSGFGELKGAPVKVKSNKASHDEAVAKRLWEVSEELTAVKFTALD